MVILAVICRSPAWGSRIGDRQTKRAEKRPFLSVILAGLNRIKVGLKQYSNMEDFCELERLNRIKVGLFPTPSGPVPGTMPSAGK